MDKQLDVRFERVEKALAVLIDSIAKYNPSEKLAEDLVAADRELAKGLQELERHQNNHARIQQLREETSSLDAQTKDTIGALWNMRKEVKNTQTTIYPPTGPKYHFTTAELLDYARRISRTTLPPPGVTNGIDLNTTSTPPGAQGTQDLDAQTPNTSFNGGTVPGTQVGTPATAAPPTPLPNGGSGSGPSGPPNLFDQSQATIASTAATQMPENLVPWVNPFHGAVFYPWPTEDNIRAGALASYQQLIDGGIEPKGYDPEEEERKREEEEQARKDAEEAARVEREEADRRMREERERMARDRERARQEAERRGSVIGGVGILEGGGAASGAKQQETKKQFAFLGGDDEDDDDDE